MTFVFALGLELTSLLATLLSSLPSLSPTFHLLPRHFLCLNMSSMHLVDFTSFRDHYEYPRKYTRYPLPVYPDYLVLPFCSLLSVEIVYILISYPHWLRNFQGRDDLTYSMS